MPILPEEARSGTDSEEPRAEPKKSKVKNVKEFHQSEVEERRERKRKILAYAPDRNGLRVHAYIF